MALIGIAEIDINELAVRIIESLGSCKRPMGCTATETLAGTAPDVRDGAVTAAMRCAEYFAEVAGKMMRPQ